MFNYGLFCCTDVWLLHRIPVLLDHDHIRVSGRNGNQNPDAQVGGVLWGTTLNNFSELRFY